MGCKCINILFFGDSSLPRELREIQIFWRETIKLSPLKLMRLANLYFMLIKQSVFIALQKNCHIK